MTSYYQSQLLISVLLVKCYTIYSFTIGVTILECQQSTNSTQHYVSVSNLPTLTSLLKNCFHNVFKTYITKHGVSLWVLISLNQGLHVLQYDMYWPH